MLRALTKSKFETNIHYIPSENIARCSKVRRMLMENIKQFRLQFTWYLKWQKIGEMC